jgi:hypothetical protein
MIINKIKTNIKFITSGDYNQLEAVHDRMLPNTDYSHPLVNSSNLQILIKYDQQLSDQLTINFLI